MNVLLSNSTDIFAGGEDYVLILAKYLRQRGHHVYVSANPGHLLLKKCTDAGIDVVPVVYQKMSRVFTVARQLGGELKRRDITIVHSNANYDRTASGIAATIARIPHVASVHSAHSIQHNITHWLRNTLWTDHFIADAEAVKRVLVLEDRIPPEKVTVIPIGVEGSVKDDDQRWRIATRARWNITPDVCVVGNVARLVPFKGHRYLLDAIAKVVRVNRSVVFVIVGDGELMETLQEQAKALEIEPYVRLLGFRDDLQELYPAFDIYCHSSLELEAEAFPLAILRALAVGLPVVATNVGGIGLMVEDGKSGYLTPPEDANALANALVKVIADPALRRTMGAASLELFQRNFHATTMAERVERVYQQVLNG